MVFILVVYPPPNFAARQWGKFVSQGAVDRAIAGHFLGIRNEECSFVHIFRVETKHTVDVCEILHQLVVYPSIYRVSSVWWCGIRNHPQCQQLYLLEFDR